MALCCPQTLLAKVSRRDLLDSILIALQQEAQASICTEPPAHTSSPLFSPPRPDTHIHTRTHTQTETDTHTQGSSLQSHSQDLQISQRTEGSIFNAADVVVVQLPMGEKGESLKADRGAAVGSWAAPGATQVPVPLQTPAGSASPCWELAQSQPICHAALSLLFSPTV